MGILLQKRIGHKTICHFGLTVNLNNSNINRKTYASLDKGISQYRRKPFTENLEEYQAKCLLNFDYNMAFFEHLNKKDFNNELNKLITKNFIEIHDLNMRDEIKGIYIMVLDNYKQIYIGQTTWCIKKEILRHWLNEVKLDKLLMDSVNHNIISINSFGPLDTTRIYVYPIPKEEQIAKIYTNLIKNIDEKYLIRKSSKRTQELYNFIKNQK